MHGRKNWHAESVTLFITHIHTCLHIVSNDGCLFSYSCTQGKMHAYRKACAFDGPKSKTQNAIQTIVCMCGRMGPEVCMNDSCEFMLSIGVSGEMVWPWGYHFFFPLHHYLFMFHYPNVNSECFFKMQFPNSYPFICKLSTVQRSWVSIRVCKFHPV